MFGRSFVGVLGIAAVLTLPVLAQQTSSISGIVRDTSGAVLPGATVEASSPSLIEKIRSVVADEQGRYHITDLVPGTYTVTFRLQGFSTIRREGIALTSGFTATINADLQVGALEETITVSGASPIVDTSNARRQTIASAELLSTLPVSNKNIQSLVTLTPGWTGVADVGGRYTAEVGAFHGKRGIKVSFDSMVIENSDGNSSYQINSQSVSEMVAQTSGVTAEVNADGPVMNIIPREGGNKFSVIGNALFSNYHMESSNLNDELRTRGFTNVNKTYRMWDEGATISGPILQDRRGTTAGPAGLGR